MPASRDLDEADRRILVVVHPVVQRTFYRILLDWVALNLPQLRDRFDVQLLAPGIAPGPRHTLLLPWLQDPVQAWSEEAYRDAVSLIERCDAVCIPTLNRVQHLAHAGKSEGSERMRRAGLRTPRMVRVSDDASMRAAGAALGYPVVLRDDWGHGGSVQLIESAAQMARMVLTGALQRPVVGQAILLPDPHDGLYRKYRYFIAGERGIPHHLQASADWITRGESRVVNERTRREELAFVESPNPHHAAFVRARQELQLDVVAFDYGLDAEGRPVVWEANPFPFVMFSTAALVYRNEALHRTVAAMIALYLERAGIALPAELSDYLEGSRSILPAAASDRQPSGAGWRIPTGDA